MNNWLNEVKKRVKKVPVSGGRSNKSERVSFDNFVFVPAQLNKRPVDYYREKIETKTTIGKNSKKPVILETPMIVAAMSFGALSKEAKMALAKASSAIGTITNTGEGGLLEEERALAKKIIVQYSTGRFGITEDVLKKADAIEIKIGQGAKGGAGGLLLGEKVTEEIAKVRKVPVGKDIHSPPYHPDIKTAEDLAKKVAWLRKITGGVPIIIKLAAGDVESDVKLAVEADPDIVALDGKSGGTGASPEVLLNEMGISTLEALNKARETLDKAGAEQELWIGGGFNTGGEMAKALAMGADAVFCGTALLVAMGCNYCRSCYLGRCPVGIATQDPDLRKKINIDSAAENVANYIKNCTEEIKIIAGACGEKDVHKLGREHILEFL